MGYRQWKKKVQGSQRKDSGWPTRTQRHNRPPASPGPSFVSVPNWEKRFCGQMRWRVFCEKKKLVYIFPRVLNWDDSAGKEAFDNAKARYWAEINHLPSEIPLPDPDMYIDEIDHNPFIDPLLVEDLYNWPPPPCEEILDYDSIQIIPTGWDVLDPSPGDNIPEFIWANPSTADDIIDSSAPIRPAGWGDESITIIPTGWGDEEDSKSINATDLPEVNNTDKKNVESMFVTAEDHSRGWQQDRRNDNMFAANESLSSREHYEHRKHKNYGRRRGGRGSLGSKHANLRCNEQGYQMNRWTKYANEQYFWRQKPSLDRGLSCAPENH